VSGAVLLFLLHAADTIRVMKDALAKRVCAAIEELKMVQPGHRVGVAVSGGADSVALLLLLIELRKELGIVLSVVHLNHTLRGRASDADEKFVSKLAAKHHLPLHAEKVDVQSIAKDKKANLEDTARRTRYAFFQRLVQEGHLDWVAVAHTADDQAETVLMHLLRGTGIAGLGGIHTVVGRVMRPLLRVRRADLRAYLRSKKQAWREDATNRDIRRFRARVRRKLLPLLEKEYQPAIVERLGTLAERARQDSAFLAGAAEKALRKAIGSASRVQVPVNWLLGPLNWEKNAENQNRAGADQRQLAEDALKNRVLKQLIAELKAAPTELSSRHIDAVYRLAQQGRNGHSLDLPGVRVRREGDVLIFDARGAQNASGTSGIPSKEFECVLDSGALRDSSEVRVPQLGCVFRLMAIDWPSKTGDTRYAGSALDRDALRFPLVLRNWRPGDKLHPIGHRNAHKLKRLLNKMRVGRWERDGWPVLTSGGVLAWARGFPVAAEFAANQRTQAGIVIVEEVIS
jgi:tRNA(Ile)-lysidine synthase